LGRVDPVLRGLDRGRWVELKFGPPFPPRARIHVLVSGVAADSVGEVGRHVPSFSSTLRPQPLDELGEWGGPPLVRGKRVLDIGCGDGRLALGVAPLATKVDGIDPDPEAIAAAKRNARKAGVRNVRFATGAAQHLPYPGAAFDVVILSWTL
jgi:2-polyprenyl-3-methyl-5-hydroxy-6-metoxy-1,4-benzoquinol methylase